MFTLKTIEEYEEILKNETCVGKKCEECIVFKNGVCTIGKLHPNDENTKNKFYKELYNILLNEYKQACEMLNINGVTNERAKTLANGIDVLTTRYRKEINCMLQEYPIKVEADFKTLEQAIGDDKVYFTFSVDKNSQLIPALLSNIRNNNCEICISTERKPIKSKVSNVGQDGSKINELDFTGSDGSKISRYF